LYRFFADSLCSVQVSAGRVLDGCGIPVLIGRQTGKDGVVRYVDR
jgi:hypothetical protein